jgi:hypothetical protein
MFGLCLTVYKKVDFDCWVEVVDGLNLLARFCAFAIGMLPADWCAP